MAAEGSVYTPSGYKLGPLTKFHKWLYKWSQDVDVDLEVPNATTTPGTCKLYWLVRLGVL